MGSTVAESWERFVMSETPAATPSGKLSREQKITNVVGLGIVLIILAAALYFARDNGVNAEVGECVKGTGSNDIKQVACDNPEAQYEVVGKMKDKDQSEATLASCRDFAGATDVHWEKNSTGSFLRCLAGVTQ
ncbi:hypothetical protein GCM10029976_094520 [Kribbella albertanoniae]|uniref:Uncharacterized protein n=1 Tax=Kribbella albertanoniae TaxID=1266829 RepID=A0A4R4QGE9_9ACTN|nr:hypothetical protein [Kribbella albertanoniae]TDC34677.1 hypothetical protein E1261_03400 [Kribbella albertanoniae]